MCFVWGSRPEAIKLGPICAELPGCVKISTGQHSELLKGTPAESDLADSISLGLESHGEVAKWVATAVPLIQDELKRLNPALVVVQGDTMSAYAGMWAATTLGIPIAHVEAGLRSGTIDEPWPEERIRRSISVNARWHFAPTEHSRRNLWAEGIPDRQIFVTGNPVVSAIHRYADGTHKEIPESQILVTMHRREWTDMGTLHVRKTVEALFQMAKRYPDVQFLWPMHPAVVKISPIHAAPNVRIVAPLGYREMIEELKRSIGIATDSGGLCEEAATLGVPCAILRNVSDRPEGIEAGLAKLFCPGPLGMKEAIRCLVARRLPRIPSDIYGKPDSASKIATHLKALVQES